jgi:glucokinase
VAAEAGTLFLGLDAGGTKTAAGVVTPAGEVLSHVRISTAELRLGDALANLIELGRRAMADAGVERVAAVGAALPGPADAAELRLLAAPTIPEWEHVSLAAPLREAFRCPVAGDNDANAAALGEARFGAGRGRSQVVYFTVSTGIGGGIVADGRIFRGARGTSAELGHQVILPEGGPPCGCGGHGCLEALASGRGIAARARQALGVPSGEPFSAEDAARLARAGNTAALRVWEDTALYLGIGVCNAVNLLDPEVVVLGGGVATGAADLLLPGVRRVVAERCMPRLARPVEVVTAELGPAVGVVGAACLAMAAVEGAEL